MWFIFFFVYTTDGFTRHNNTACTIYYSLEFDRVGDAFADEGVIGNFKLL